MRSYICDINYLSTYSLRRKGYFFGINFEDFIKILIGSLVLGLVMGILVDFSDIIFMNKKIVY